MKTQNLTPPTIGLLLALLPASTTIATATNSPASVRPRPPEPKRSVTARLGDTLPQDPTNPAAQTRPATTPEERDSEATEGEDGQTPATATDHSAADHSEKKPDLPPEARLVEHDEDAFRPDPTYEEQGYDPEAQRAIYGGKHLNKAARPPIEWGRPLYDRGEYDPAGTWLGERNPTAPHFMVYGDLRLAGAYNDDGVPAPNGETHQATVATRLNLDIDWKITATERLHVFVRPFDQGGSFLRYDLDGKNEGFEEEFDFNLETAFFEGELGPIVRGFTGRQNEIDLPFTLGLIPMLTQNGIWMEDAFLGTAFTIPAFSSRGLDISNMDLTFFAGFDRVTTTAVTDAAGRVADHDANLYGLAGFAEANRGYWEFGYGYVDSEIDDLSYHNATLAFSRRYGATLSNSVRLIGNFGQNPAPGRQKTADGVLLLIENSLITSKPYTLVPYFNLFAGFDRPQALARAAGAGGVLKNTGINFETDGLTGFPKLDDRGHDAYGGAFGVEYLFNLDRQLVFEVATVQRIDRGPLDPGAEYAFGVRFQEPLDNAWIFRFDAMHGWLEGRENIFGVRFEIRRKF